MRAGFDSLRSRRPEIAAAILGGCEKIPLQCYRHCGDLPADEVRRTLSAARKRLPGRAAPLRD